MYLAQHEPTNITKYYHHYHHHFHDYLWLLIFYVYYYYCCWYHQYLFCLPSLLLLLCVIVTWNDMPMGGLAQAFFSRVVAISSTEATSALSVCPVKRLIFHTRACFLASYFALPACWD